MKILVITYIFLGIISLFAESSNTKPKKYLPSEVKVDLETSNIYEKSTNKLLNGTIIVSEKKGTLGNLYIKVSKGFLKRIDNRDSTSKDTKKFISIYDKELKDLFLSSNGKNIKAKMNNHALYYFELDTKDVSVKMELNKDKLEKFFFSFPKKKIEIKLVNGKINYYSLESNKIIKSIESKKDKFVNKIVKGYTSKFLKEKPAKYFTYGAQLLFLHEDSKSSLSLKQCKNILGEKNYKKLSASHKSKKILIKNCQDNVYMKIQTNSYLW